MDSIHYKELFEIISVSQKKGRTDIDIDLVVLAVCERLKIKSSDILRKKVVCDIRKYRHNKIHVKKACVENTELLIRIAINANDYEKVENLDPVATANISEDTDDIEVNGSSSSTSSSGGSRKSFVQLGKKMQRNRTNEILNVLQSFIDNESSLEENSLGIYYIE